MSFTKSDYVALEEVVDMATNKLDRRKTDQGWHLKKEVSVSVIISVLGVAVAGMTAYSDLKKEIALIQSDVKTLRVADNETRESMRETVMQFNRTVDKIDAKLDRIIERGKK
jgi:hypothetical protein